MKQADKIDLIHSSSVPMYNDMPISIFMIDVNHTVIFWNRHIEKLTGISSKEIVGTSNHWKIFYSKKRKMLSDFIVDEVEEETMREYYSNYFEGEFKILSKNEVESTCENLVIGSNSFYTISTPIYTDGEISGAIEVSKDISERKTLEKQLFKNKEIFNDIIQFLPNPTFAIDIDGKVIAWNRELENLTGIKKEKMIGKGDYEYSIPFYGKRCPMIINQVFERNENVIKKYKSFYSSGEYIIAENNITLLDSREILVQTKAGPLYNSDGEIVGAIETLQDITEAKINEMLLLSSEEKFYKIFTYNPSVMLILDASNKKIIDANKKFRSVFNLHDEIVISKSLSQLKIINKQQEEQILKDTIKNHKSEITPIKIKSDKKYFIFYNEQISLKERNCILLTLEDVTEIRNVHKEISGTIERERFRIGQDLHDDLGQHLTGISFMIESLKDDYNNIGMPVSNEIYKIEKLLESAVAKVRNISKSLSPIELKDTGFEDAIDEMVNQIKEIFLVSVSVSKKGDLKIIDLNTAVNLFYIIRESVNNSLKHSNATNISIKLEKNKNKLKIRVKDNGTNFSEKEIFEGIGLRIMKYRASNIGAAFKIKVDRKGVGIYIDVLI